MITAGKRSLAPLVAALGQEPTRVATDGELLNGFLSCQDEVAFEALVRRHGPMVLAVCRRALGRTTDAEDAFQATFLVLLQKAPGLASRTTLGDWLHGVARRIALKARTAAARRRAREGSAARPEGNPGVERNDWLPWLDEEVGRLPAKYRLPLVLCDLEGQTRGEAARALGWPEGTVAGYLARGRALLARRLLRRASAAGGIVTGGLAGGEALAVPHYLLAATVPAALGSASPAVLAFAREVLRGMTTITNALAVGILALVTGGLLAAGTLIPGTPENPVLNAPAAPLEPGPPSAAKPAPQSWKERESIELTGWLGGSVAYSPDGKALFVGGTDGHVRVWDAGTWKERWTADAGRGFAAVAVSGDGKTVAATVPGGVRLLDASDGKPGRTLKVEGDPRAVAFSPDGKWVATSTGNASGFRALDDNGGAAGVAALVAGVPPAAVAWSPDSLYLAYAHPTGADGPGLVGMIGVTPDTKPRNIPAHQGPVTTVAWSKDGKVVASGGADGSVILWDRETFQEQSRLVLGGRVVVVAISPDGRHIAAAVVRPQEQRKGKESYTEEVFVCEAATPPAKPEPISTQATGGLFTGVASLTFSPDSKSLASAFCNFTHLARTGEVTGKVRVFAVEPEKPKSEQKPRFVGDVRFSPDGKRYAIVAGGEVRVHDTATQKLLFAVPGEAVGYSADGKTLFVMGAKVLQCDAETSKTIKEYPRPKTKWGWHLVAFAPDGKRYAAHFGFHVRIYDTATGFEPQQLDNQYEPGSSTLPATTGKQLVWSPDGKQVAAVGVLVDVGKIGMAGWDVETGKQFYSFASDFTDGPRAAAFSSDSNSIAIGYEKRVDVWTGGLNPVKNLGEHGLVSALAFTPDGKTLAAGIRLPILHGGDKPPRVIGHKTEVRLIDLATAKVVKVFDGFEGVSHMAETKLPVTALAFSPDGKKLTAVTGIPLFMEIPKDAPKSGEVKVFDLSTPPEKPDPAPAAAQKWTEAAVLTDHGRLVNGVAVAPDGKSFAAATDGNVTAWNATTRKVFWIHKADAPFLTLAYCPDGVFLAASHQDGVSLLDAATGKPIQFPGRKGPIDRGPSRINPYAVAFSPRGNLFASAAYGCGIRVINTATGADAGWPLLADEYLVDPPSPADPPPLGPPIPTALAFSPDGSKLAVATHQRGKAARVRIHDAKTGKILGTLDGTPTAGLAWSKDGKAIASGGQDGLVIMSDATCGQELWRHAFKGRDDTIGRVNALAISPADGTVSVAVALGSGKGADRVVLLAAKDSRVVGQVMRWSIPVSSVAWFPDGKSFVTGCGAAGRPGEQAETPVGEVVVWERKP